MTYRIYTSVSLPRHSFSSAKNFIFTPEKWGTGPLTFFGISSFRIEKAHSVIRHEQETCVFVNILKEEVMLRKTDQHPNKLEIIVPQKLYVSLRICPFSEHKDTGLYLSLLIRSDQEIPFDPPYIKTILYKFLFQGLGSNESEPHPVLDAFRSSIH